MWLPFLYRVAALVFSIAAQMNDKPPFQIVLIVLAVLAMAELSEINIRLRRQAPSITVTKSPFFDHIGKGRNK